MGELFSFIALIGLTVHFVRRNHDPKKAEQEKRVRAIVKATCSSSTYKGKKNATH